ncbi:MAG TPA: OmpH family outer membrane protein [Pyrinomonadaceae bacterium]|nr:OmpH family outer membrane protein [Pyrinomonadaceae bacterium]
MKKFSMFAVAAVFAAIFAVGASAQTAPMKIGLVNTSIFTDEKEGLKRVGTAVTQLNNELRPKEQELTTLQTRIRSIEDELRKLQSAAPNTPINETTFTTKREEGARLARELEFKNKEYEAFREKRQNEILGPVNADIARALDDYAKQKGYTMIFDIVPLAQSSVLLSADASADITRDFVTFYNARQPGAATAANPR